MDQVPKVHVVFKNIKPTQIFLKKFCWHRLVFNHLCSLNIIILAWTQWQIRKSLWRVFIILKIILHYTGKLLVSQASFLPRKRLSLFNRKLTFSKSILYKLFIYKQVITSSKIQIFRTGVKKRIEYLNFILFTIVLTVSWN